MAKQEATGMGGDKRERQEIIRSFYEGYDEDGRLERDNSHRLEWIVSTRCLDRHIRPGDSILEVGAGTGAYSIHYAGRGHHVHAVDLVAHNLDILRSKVSDNMNIETSQGDATDLSMFGDGEFDVTLVLGPLYHLFDEAEIRSAIAEAVRVTRPGGTVAFAYLPSDSVCAHEDIIAELMDDRNHFFDDDFNLRRIPDEVFATLRIDELEEILSDYEIEILREVATDGIAPLVKDRINSLTDKQFSVWVEYQMAVCERRELQGYSSHMLCICRRLPADGI